MNPCPKCGNPLVIGPGFDKHDPNYGKRYNEKSCIWCGFLQIDQINNSVIKFKNRQGKRGQRKEERKGMSKRKSPAQMAGENSGKIEAAYKRPAAEVIHEARQQGYDAMLEVAKVADIANPHAWAKRRMDGSSNGHGHTEQQAQAQPNAITIRELKRFVHGLTSGEISALATPLKEQVRSLSDMLAGVDPKGELSTAKSGEEQAA